MRKIIVLFCLFLMCGCSSVEKIETNQVIHYEIAKDLPILYGGGYRIVEAWDGFKVEEFSGLGNDKKGNEIFRNDDFAIENKLVNSFGSQFTYIYNDGSKTSELYTGMLNQKDDIYPTQPTAFQMNDHVYFTYYEMNHLVINLVEDGKLVEYKRIPLEDDNYKFKGLIHNDYEMYYKYKNEDNIKYVCDEREYIFKNTDRVIFMKDYIFYSTFESENVTGSYIVKRNTNEVIQLEENIHLVLDPLIDLFPNISNNKILDNCFIFVDKVDGQLIYTYGMIEDNTFKKVLLPYSYSENDSISFYDKQTIFLSKTNTNENLDFYVIEVK